MGSSCSSEAKPSSGLEEKNDSSASQKAAADMDTKKQELTEETKPFGMHISAIRKFLSDHPDVVTKSLTTSQTNRAVVKPETLGSNKPYIDKYREQTDENGVKMVATATVFVSHAWRYSFADTVADSMEQHALKEPDTYFWFDLFTNDQNAIASRDFDWFSNTFRNSVIDIGKVLLILSPWHSPLPICRAWCLFEISTALGEEAVEMFIYLPRKQATTMSSTVQEDSDCLIQALSDIQAENAEATSEDDKKQIFSVIQESEGGFFAVNNHVKNKLREWYVGQLRTSVAESPDNLKLQDAVVKILYGFAFYDEALEHSEKLLQIKLDKLGEQHPDVATSYNQIAMYYMDKHKLDKALEYNEKSLAIRLHALGEQHPDVATSYNNIANIYLNQGDLSKAQGHYEKALSINLSTCGEDNPEVAVIYNNLATVYTETDELDKALLYHNKYLSIQLSKYDEHNFNVAPCYINMAHVYQKKNDFEEALKCYDKALPIILNTLGEDHPLTANIYYSMSVAYNGKGDLEKAEEYRLKSGY